MIGEFLQPSSVKISPPVKVEGNTPTNPPKSHPLEVKIGEMLKVRVKRKSQKHDIPLPSKSLLQTPDPKDYLLGSYFGKKGP